MAFRRSLRVAVLCRTGFASTATTCQGKDHQPTKPFRERRARARGGVGATTASDPSRIVPRPPPIDVGATRPLVVVDPTDGAHAR